MPTAFLLLWTALSAILDGLFLLFPRTFIRRVAGGAARTVCRMFVFGMIPTQILVEPPLVHPDFSVAAPLTTIATHREWSAPVRVNTLSQYVFLSSQFFVLCHSC